MVRVDRADPDELYVVLEDGVQRVGHVAADIIRFSDSQGARDIITVAADAISAIPTVETLPVTKFPDTVAAVARDAVVCAQWRPGEAKDGSNTVLAGSAVPLAAGQAPVALAQADGIGPNVDAAFVPPGRCLYVESMHRYLIADTGVRFGVQDVESAAALGFPSQRVAGSMADPEVARRRTRTQPRRRASRARRLAPDPRAIALPGTAAAPR